MELHIRTFYKNYTSEGNRICVQEKAESNTEVLGNFCVNIVFLTNSYPCTCPLLYRYSHNN